MMARHKANHIQLAYASSADAADRALMVRSSMAEALGIQVHVCGTKKNGQPWVDQSRPAYRPAVVHAKA
jgi:hypothetical protein